jgi:Fur family ferric uptake transcriptional regulator
MKGDHADGTQFASRADLNLDRIVGAGEIVEVSGADKLNEKQQRCRHDRGNRTAPARSSVSEVTQRCSPFVRVPLIRIAIGLQVQGDCALVGNTMLSVSGHHRAQKKPLSAAGSGANRRLGAVQQARLILKSLGLRGTAARLAVVRYMLGASVPKSHAEVASALKAQGFDSATIYRNLIELTRARLLARVDLGDHVWRYERTRSAGQIRESHPHFVCDDCGSVACLDADEVRISRRGDGARVRQVSSITVKGRCRSC